MSLCVSTSPPTPELPEAVKKEAREVVVELLGGSVTKAETDLAVTHLLAEEGESEHVHVACWVFACSCWVTEVFMCVHVHGSCNRSEHCSVLADMVASPLRCV